MFFGERAQTAGDHQQRSKDEGKARAQRVRMGRSRLKRGLS